MKKRLFLPPSAYFTSRKGRRPYKGAMAFFIRQKKKYFVSFHIIKIFQNGQFSAQFCQIISLY